MKVKWILLVGVVLIASLRMYKLPYPNFENTGYEMFDNPATARNFVRDGLNPLTPRHDAGAEGSCFSIKVGSKYFTYPYIVSLLYFIFGVHEIIGRIVTLLFSLGTTFLIFKLGENYFDRLIGIIAAVLFNILPITIHNGQTWIRYHTYVFFLVLMYYLFLKWIENEKNHYILLSSISGALAFLTNPPGMYMGLPILYLCVKKFKWEFIKKWQLYLFALISLAPIISWWGYGMKFSPASPLTDFKEMVAYLGFDAENPPRMAIVWRELTNPKYYFQWAKFDFIGKLISTLSKNALTPVGMILLAVGLFIKKQEQYRYQFHFWGLAFLIYCFIDSRMVYTADGLHHHHYIEFTPVACLLIASGGKYIWDFLKENTKTWDLKVVASLVVILYFVNFFTYLGAWIEPGVNMTAYRVAKAVEEKTPKDAVLLTENGVHTAVIYYSNRTGWPMNLIDGALTKYSGIEAQFDKKDYGGWQREQSNFIKENYHTPKLIDFFIKKGATHYVITNYSGDGMKSKLKDYVIENFEIVDRTNEYIIANLRKRIN